MKRTALIITAIGVVMLLMSCKGFEKNEEAVLKIPYIEGVKIDGNTDEWASNAYTETLFADNEGNVPYSGTFSGKMMLGWNEKGMIYGLKVEDDKFVEFAHQWGLWLRDHVALYLADKKGGENFLQLAISPGLSADYNEPRSKMYYNRKSESLKDVDEKSEIAVKPVSGGYSMEVLIPFTNLGIKAKKGTRAAVQVLLGDYDDSKGAGLRWYWQDEAYKNSYSMQEIELDEQAGDSVNACVKVKVVDEEKAHFYVYADKKYVGKEILAVVSNKTFYSGQLEEGPQYASCIFDKDFPTEFEDIGNVYFSLGGKIIDIIEPDKVLMTYEPEHEHAHAEYVKKLKVMQKRFPAPQGVAIFIGSSSMRMWKSLAEDMAPMEVRNLGFGGSTMNDVLFYFDYLLDSYSPSKIVVYEGDNDLAGDMSVDEFMKSCEKFYKRVEDRFGGIPIYQLAIKPSIKRFNKWEKYAEANERLKMLAEKKDNLTFIDVASPMIGEDGQPKEELFSSDDLHMNDKGYDLWERIVKPVVSE